MSAAIACIDQCMPIVRPLERLPSVGMVRIVLVRAGAGPAVGTVAWQCGYSLGALPDRSQPSQQTLLAAPRSGFEEVANCQRISSSAVTVASGPAKHPN